MVSNISEGHIPGSTTVPSQTAFPSLNFGVLPWTYIGRHREAKSHNTCVCLHCKNVVKGLGRYKKQCLFLGPTVVLGRVGFYEYPIYFYLIDTNGRCNWLCCLFFPVAASKLRASSPPNSSKFIPHACLCTDLTLGSFLSFSPLFPFCHIFFIFQMGCILFGRHLCNAWHK